MKLSQIKVGEVYAFEEQRKKRSGWRGACMHDAQPAKILSKEKMTVIEGDGCGRKIPVKRTVIIARVYNVSAADDKYAESLEKLDRMSKKKKAFVDQEIRGRQLIWPWADEVQRVREIIAEEHKRKNGKSFVDLLELDVINIFESYGFDCSTYGSCAGDFGVAIRLPIARNSKQQPRFWSRYDHQTQETVGRYEPEDEQIARLQGLIQGLIQDLDLDPQVESKLQVVDMWYDPDADYVDAAKEFQDARRKANAKVIQRDQDFDRKKYTAWCRKHHPERFGD